MTPKQRNTRLALGIILVAFVALLAAVVPYHPILVPGPNIAATPLALSKPVPGLRLHVFNTGANRMSSLLVGPSPPWRAAPAFVIEHPSGGLVAFDLGLSHAVAARGEQALSLPLRWLMQSRGRPGLTLEAQMREAGLAPGDVEHVVISHLHEDHTGVAGEFAEASFIAGPGTRERVLAGGQSPFGSGGVPEWREVGGEGEASVARSGSFEVAEDLFADGSLLILSGGGGHTSEDLLLLVNLESGPVLLTGDAVVHFDWLASDDVERIASDPERAAVLRNQVRALHASGAALVIPGHDLRQLGEARADLIRHHPERFAPDAWPIER